MIYGVNCLATIALGLGGLWFVIDLLSRVPLAGLYVWAVMTAAFLGVVLYASVIFIAAMGLYNLKHLKEEMPLVVKKKWKGTRKI